MIHIKLKDLHPMVVPQCTNEVKASILKIGLKNPVVVIKTTKEEWKKESDSIHFILNPPNIEGEFYQIRFGHNRVAALLELGRSEVPCIVCNTINEAADIGRSHALWQKQKLNPL